MQAFVVEYNGNTEAGVLAHPLLDRVGVFRHGAGIAIFAGARNFAEAVFHQRCGTFREKLALLVDKECLRVGEKLLVLPGAFQLGDFFLEGHAGQQVGDSLIHGKLGVAIGQGILGHRCRAEKRGRSEEKKCPRRVAKFGKQRQGWPPEKICMLAIQKVRGTIPPPLTYTVKEIAIHGAYVPPISPRTSPISRPSWQKLLDLATPSVSSGT